MSLPHPRHPTDSSAPARPRVPRVEPVRQDMEARLRFAQQAARHTPAMLGVGHVGTRYPTSLVLQFQAELAVAAELPPGWAEAHGLLPLQSRVHSHHEFLLRPDLGRRLNEDSLALLREKARQGVDVQPIVADGLSAVACQESGVELLRHLTRECEARGWSVGTPLCARYARVWLEDEIGQEVRARVAVILLGERPGLGTGDGLSAYLVYEPRVGRVDSDRNMLCNIHARGTPPEEAARRMAVLVGAMLAQRTSGVSLDLAPLQQELGDAARPGYRVPPPRTRLVQVHR